jgi:hypothetical protein
MLGIERKEMQQRSERIGREVSSLHKGRIVAQLKKRKKKKKVLHWSRITGTQLQRNLL